MMRLTAMFGRRIEALRSRISKTGDRIGGQAWADLTQRAQDAVEDTPVEQLRPGHLRPDRGRREYCGPVSAARQRSA